MIPDLLWRCPLCAANDALVHRRAWLRAETVSCTVCGARWRVRRAVGDDFYLRLTQPGSSQNQCLIGEERRLAAWYHLMKQSLHLEPVSDENLPIALFDGESLYLASGEAELWGVPSQGGARGFFEPVYLDRGRLFLTNARLVWQGDTQQADYPLRHVNGVYAIINFNLALVVGQQMYQVLFARESPLKWVSYAARLALRVQAESGHLLRTSHD